MTVDDQGNAVWTAARSAGAEGPDTDRARDLKPARTRTSQLLGLRPRPGGDQELPHRAGRGVSDGPTGGEAPIARRQGQAEPSTRVR